ncbi:U3 snoRNP protein [Coemansia sp. RSA 989]|nr:WD40-repeat-containing domain protein [Coemansia mojavensis]KAJ1740300.1 U3 snoRNP protein [Coemansia sp. RSA 1086]KAJ1748941.1 U3 snoRNP protein [Coemansia sp. RSA 1821]KAJ1863122.1 U3 snoRNP protein [Coemansia sp. RSA 989]KAJ1871863.1 U3 snoRNP protein [Coemansia sp. RSA 990]KAJ2673757.1 U3 snoRNP protein [Coemansia sp. RSA 1085]
MSEQIQTKRLFTRETEEELDTKRAKTSGEVDLEKLVFGEDVIGSTVFDDKEEEESSEDEQDDSLFYVDTERDGIEESEESSAESEEAAWEDDDIQNSRVALKATARNRKLRVEEDEDEVSGDVYEQRLRQQFEKINPVPKWALTENDQSGGILQSSSSLISKQQALLPPNVIDIVRQRNANQEAVSQAVIQSVQFHPTASVLLTAGMDKTLRLFEVDGKENHKVQSIYFKDLPITTAQFIRQGQEVVVSGRRGWFYSVDVEKSKVTRVNSNPKLKSLEGMKASVESDRLAFMGNSGQIHLVSARTKQFVHTLQMNGPVRDVSFTADGNYLWSIGLDNEVYQWDLRQNQCLTRWHDPTVFRPTCLQVSRDSSYYASGDDAGVINIYDTRSIEAQPFVNVKPFKSISNLTTAIQGVKFNHSSELLAVYSRKKKDQLKLVHLPTASVFTNWPGSVSHLGHVQCVDFSPNSGFMAIGNDSGKALLYRLQHYSAY